MPDSLKGEIRTGSCLCGAVRFEVVGEMRQVIACHCSQCRKQSGHYYAATSAPDESMTIHGRESLKWFRSSPGASRGFCRECGSVLFWKQQAGNSTSILAGSLNKPTGLKLIRHINCADKGDYYEITDNLPKN